MNPNTVEVDEFQLRKDNDHLRIIAIFHFVFGGFSLFGLGFLCLHGLIMGTVFTQPAITRGPNPPPVQLFYVLGAFYFGAGCFLLMGMLANFASGYFLLKRKHRMFSMIVAGVNCLQIPLGTILGVCSLLVLLRPSVAQTYLSGPVQNEA